VVFNSKEMEFFPLQLYGGCKAHYISNKNAIRLPEVVTACVYRDEFLIVMRKHDIVKYPFLQDPNNTRRIGQNGEILEIQNFKFSASEHSKMAVVNNGLGMIICNWNWSIYTIVFSAQRTQVAKSYQVGEP